MLILISRRIELLAAHPEKLAPDAQQVLASVQELIRNTQRGVRRFAQGLRPPALDHLGLVAAIRGLANGLTNKNDIETELRVKGEPKRLAPEKELALFRIAQETLNNAMRHAEASWVVIQIEFSADKIRMLINDNGRGFDVPERLDSLVSTGRLGLIGMHERARNLGGTLTINSKPRQGTVVTVEMPIQ
jgi:signal transduction histidine kinase